MAAYLKIDSKDHTQYYETKMRCMRAFYFMQAVWQSIIMYFATKACLNFYSLKNDSSVSSDESKLRGLFTAYTILQGGVSLFWFIGMCVMLGNGYTWEDDLAAAQFCMGVEMILTCCIAGSEGFDELLMGGKVQATIYDRNNMYIEQHSNALLRGTLVEDLE